MSGIVPGWLATALAGLAVGVVLVVAALLLPRAVRILTTRVYCPWAGRTVQVRTLALDGQDPICVVSCTAFADPRAVTCGMPCIGGDCRGDLAPGNRCAETLLDE